MQQIIGAWAAILSRNCTSSRVNSVLFSVCCLGPGGQDVNQHQAASLLLLLLFQTLPVAHFWISKIWTGTGGLKRDRSADPKAAVALLAACVWIVASDGREKEGIFPLGLALNEGGRIFCSLRWLTKSSYLSHHSRPPAILHFR